MTKHDVDQERITHLSIADAGSVEETQQVEEGQPGDGAHVNFPHQLLLVDARDIYVRVIDVLYSFVVGYDALF